MTRIVLKLQSQGLARRAATQPHLLSRSPELGPLSRHRSQRDGFAFNDGQCSSRKLRDQFVREMFADFVFLSFLVFDRAIRFHLRCDKTSGSVEPFLGERKEIVMGRGVGVLQVHRKPEESGFAPPDSGR